VIGNPNPLLFGPEGFVFSIIAVKLPSRGLGRIKREDSWAVFAQLSV
jgi:hypothetical protein